MKEYIQLYREYDKSYYPIDSKFPSVWHLNHFLESDYRSLDQDIFIKTLNYYNAHFVYNDLKHGMMYIGFANWLIDEAIDGPPWDDFGDYINQLDSCRISIENFKEFIKKWLFLKKEQIFPFMLIYRNDHDWVDCKGFESQDEMEMFVKNNLKC